MSKVRNAPKYLEYRPRSKKHIRIQYEYGNDCGFHAPKIVRKSTKTDTRPNKES
jgi:hypothetical protein